MSLLRPVAQAARELPSFAVETMLRIHFRQRWFGLYDSAREEVLHDVSLYSELARLDPGAMRLSGETTILRFRHCTEGGQTWQQSQ